MRDPVVEEAVTDVVDVLRRRGAVFAYVFGSRVEGGARPTSDIDVAASWAGSPPRDWLAVQAELPDGCELVVLDTAPLELAGRVAMRGDLLFEDDPPERVRWEATTRRIWLDEQWRRERARADFKAGALARGRR